MGNVKVFGSRSMGSAITCFDREGNFIHGVSVEELSAVVAVISAYSPTV